MQRGNIRQSHCAVRCNLGGFWRTTVPGVTSSLPKLSDQLNHQCSVLVAALCRRRAVWTAKPERGARPSSCHPPAVRSVEFMCIACVYRAVLYMHTIQLTAQIPLP